MDTEAWPVSSTTSMAELMSSSYSSSPSTGLEPPTPLEALSFSAACCSISCMTWSSYWAEPLFCFTKSTTAATSWSEMRQPCTRVGFPEPRGK